MTVEESRREGEETLEKGKKGVERENGRRMGLEIRKEWKKRENLPT